MSHERAAARQEALALIAIQKTKHPDVYREELGRILTERAADPTALVTFLDELLLVASVAVSMYSQAMADLGRPMSELDVLASIDKGIDRLLPE